MDPNNPVQEQTETQPEFDTSAAIADISSELFGQGGEGEKDPAEGPEAPVVESATVEPPADGAEENSQAVQETGAPSTWTKEALQDWAAIPDRAKQEILKREEDMMRGIQQYKTAADVGEKYNSVVEPFKPILEAEGVDPVQLFQSFASNHYLLSRGTPEQKVELAANMLSHYGIDLPALVDYFGERALNPVDPRVQQLEQQVRALTQNFQQQATQSTEAQRQAALTEVEQFAAANPYFDELVADIAKFMETGVASTLQEAYDKAVYANPVTRQKELDRLTAERAKQAEAAEKARKDKLSKSQADHVTTSGHHRDGTVPVGSMDDTLAQTLAAIQGRG